MKKTIVVFLMACSTVQARQAVGFMPPSAKTMAAGGLHHGINNNLQSGSTGAAKPTTTEYTSADVHTYAVTNDAFDKIGLVGLP